MAVGASPNGRAATKSSRSNKHRKNPYADLGRDKFSALLAQVEKKKQEILSQVGSERVSLVHFVCSADNKLKPVVVIAKGNKEGKVKFGGEQTDKPAAYQATEAKKTGRLAECSAAEEKKDKHRVTEAAKAAEGDAKKETTAADEDEARETGGFEAAGFAKKSRWWSLPPSNYGYLISMAVLIFLLVAMFERYRSTLYLLEMQSRLCVEKKT
ncbi:hypothetical protein Nepgr_005030 [Nepenthes gracilis]|uniref:Uncharacterized protein n=1 Tax=Nepenthes gracilis TaxID=150966 RepID=A0AAD3S2J3_NEPGR|nr:hypothetical protein Nepgr_005030 [Nepenthes gracilis]